eukprot:gene35446-47650_t
MGERQRAGDRRRGHRQQDGDGDGRDQRDREEAEQLWAVRRKCSGAMFELGDAKLNEDIVIPMRSYVTFAKFLKRLKRESGLYVPTFGHLADGNLHVNIMYHRADKKEMRAAEKAVQLLMETVVKLGGSISGEHGIGLAKTPFLRIQHSPAQVRAMQAVKAALDPKGILNPGKMFDVFHRPLAVGSQMKRRDFIFGGVAALSVAPGALRAAEAARVLFDGATLAGWKPSAFDSQKEVKVEKAFRDGKPAIVAEKSDYLSGISWADAATLPKTNYEISLAAMRVGGSDFFCGLTFPVGESACTFVVGGWSGMVVGLSNVDNMDASENETSQGKEFKSGRWYRIRVRVTPAKIEAWIDDEQMVDLETKDKKIGLRFGDISHSLPLGIAAYQTEAAWRELRLKQW